MRGRRVSVGGGFGVLLAVLLFLDEQNILPWALLACLIHELGHYLMIQMLGGRVCAFRLSIVGAEMTPERKRLFSYREELLIAAAGPLASLSAALLAGYAARAGQWEGLYLFCGLNLLAGLFNLLPVSPLDGGRILRILISQWFEVQAEVICNRVTGILAAGLLALGVFLMLFHGTGVTLILTSAWLLAGNRRGIA